MFWWAEIIWSWFVTFLCGYVQFHSFRYPAHLKLSLQHFLRVILQLVRVILQVGFVLSYKCISVLLNFNIDRVIVNHL